MENGLAELDSDIFAHLEPYAIIFGSEITLIVNDASAIVRDLLELAACTTFRGCSGWLLTCCGLRLCRVNFLLLDWVFSLDLDQIPVLEIPSVDDGEGYLFAIRACCDIDPVVLQLEIVTRLVLELA